MSEGLRRHVLRTACAGCSRSSGYGRRLRLFGVSPGAPMAAECERVTVDRGRPLDTGAPVARETPAGLQISEVLGAVRGLRTAVLAPHLSYRAAVVAALPAYRVLVITFTAGQPPRAGPGRRTGPLGDLRHVQHHLSPQRTSACPNSVPDNTNTTADHRHVGLVSPQTAEPAAGTRWHSYGLTGRSRARSMPGWCVLFRGSSEPLGNSGRLLAELSGL
jgi:hypothetical protein